PGMGVVAPSAQGAATNFSVVADERTNSLVVLASSLQMRQIKDLVAQLDIHSPNETSRIHVYRLKYAAAAEMVDVLNGLLSGGGGTSGNSLGGKTGSTTASSSGSKNPNFENPVSVTADPATSSLVVSAAPQDYETLRRVIDQLDIPRVQVFVQAIIVEVSVNHS